MHPEMEIFCPVPLVLQTAVILIVLNQYQIKYKISFFAEKVCINAIEINIFLNSAFPLIEQRSICLKHRPYNWQS